MNRPTMTFFQAAIEGRLKEIAETNYSLVAQSTRAAVVQAATYTRNALRRQVRAAGLGGGLEKSWQVRVFPKSKPSLNPAAWVYTKAKKVMAAFSANTTIRSRNAEALIIPTSEAERLGLSYSARGGRLRSARHFNTAKAEMLFGPLFTLETSFGRKVLMGRDKAGREIVLGTLVRQTRLRQVIDLVGPREKFGAQVPRYFANQFNRLSAAASRGRAPRLAFTAED